MNAKLAISMVCAGVLLAGCVTPQDDFRFRVAIIEEVTMSALETLKITHPDGANNTLRVGVAWMKVNASRSEARSIDDPPWPEAQAKLLDAVELAERHVALEFACRVGQNATSCEQTFGPGRVEAAFMVVWTLIPPR